MSFDSIPTDLLLKMFDRLPFKDRVRLRGVNRLFNDVSEKSISTMRSLEMNDDLVKYSIMVQTFPSLLETCSPILEFIDVTNPSPNQWMLNALAEFIYPKLDHLKITDKGLGADLAKKLIGRNRNLRSIFFHLDRHIEWPENVTLDKLERLEIHSSDGNHGPINLSPTLRPLIGKVPNLKHFSIDGIGTDRVNFELPVQELSQLLATTPLIQELHLSRGCYISNHGNFVAALPTWHLPNLKSLVIGLNIPSTILHCFPTSFPRLESFESDMIGEIDDQAVVALSQLKQLRELRLHNVNSVIIQDNFIEMVSVLPSIAVLDIGYNPSLGWRVDPQVIKVLSQLKYLRELCLRFPSPTKDKIIELVTNIPTLAVLKISTISNVDSPRTLVDFLKSTAAIFQRNLEIRPICMVVEYEMELDQMHAILEEIKNNGGPMVEMEGFKIRSIRYNP